MKTKLPFMKFFTGDWMKDPALRSVSLSARGLWIDMLCLMWEAHRRGYLCHRTGLPVTLEQLARMVGSSAAEVDHLVQELVNCGVCSRAEDGVLYSRRMERDEQVRKTAACNGRKGGNPQLMMKGVNQRSNPLIKGEVIQTSYPHIQSSETESKLFEKAPIAPTRGGTPPPEGKRRFREYPPDFERFFETYPRQVGKDAAHRAWRNAIQRLQVQRVQDRTDVCEFLQQRAKVYADSPAGNRGQFTPHPSTWLNEGRYLDDDSEWQRTHDDRRCIEPGPGQIAPGSEERF